jgi:hypothetical protein
MLAYCDRDFDKPVVKIPPRFGAATPIRVAANAVMAGCKPEYFPLVLLALEALAKSLTTSMARRRPRTRARRC